MSRLALSVISIYGNKQILREMFMERLASTLVIAVAALVALVLPSWASWPSEDQAVKQPLDTGLVEEQINKELQTAPVFDRGVEPVPIEVSVEGGQVIAREDGTFVVISPQSPLRIYRRAISPLVELVVFNGQVVLHKDGSITVFTSGQPQRELSKEASVDIHIGNGQVIIEGSGEQVIIQSDGTIIRYEKEKGSSALRAYPKSPAARKLIQAQAK